MRGLGEPLPGGDRLEVLEGDGGDASHGEGEQERPVDGHAVIVRLGACAPTGAVRRRVAHRLRPQAAGCRPCRAEAFEAQLSRLVTMHTQCRRPVTRAARPSTDSPGTGRNSPEATRGRPDVSPDSSALEVTVEGKVEERWPREC
ncbi:hypothetical protein GCM10010503_45800 [Streptomyces lucensis JCM 4490]|uniref:Uncharacterized protein n=1 Tax=Streptomyces lucensis JCM 4490 TaxID=1306176 RepID=A0A918MSW8_9ACTN|nr:hypothetical protein GCM10010503_45800 [Streptomyces lucensis JCM 4490]